MGPDKQKLGGRPKIPWTASRKRKLIRLYLMTTLDYHQIRALISTDGFDPCRRYIQSQLSTLLPNVKKNRRIYRPSGISQGQARLAVWKRCRKYATSRHARHKLESRREPQGLPEKRNTTEDAPIPSPTLLRTSPYYDPLAHWNYEAVLPFGIPSHVSMPEIGSWYSNTHMKPSLLGGQAPSSREENHDSDKEVHASLAQVNGSEGLPPVLGQLPADITRQVSQTRVSDDRTSNPPTRRVSTASFRTMSTRISSGISSSLRHANSVLSMTNSVRSSLLSAMSLSSRSSSISRNVSLSAQEQWIHDMIVDEASIQPTPIATCVRSLHQRPCCNFNVLGVLGDARCELCGFAAIHELFRIQCGSDDVLGDITTRDTFGNTPLHHAAAAGNTKRIENVLRAITTSGVPLLALRNTSGETFLHVALEPVDLFSSSYPAHGEIYNQFKVNMRDFRGRPVADKVLRTDIGGRPRFDSVEELSLSLIEAIKALDLDYGGQCLRVEKLLDEDRRNERLHVRDEKGLTALAIAAARGYPDIVLSLLNYGANPNARTREGPRGRSILSFVAEQMQEERDDTRFSRMLCCANILADNGAKFEPTEFEEYRMKHVEPAAGNSRGNAAESVDSPPASEQTCSHREPDTMTTKRKISTQIFKSRQWNPKPQVTSKAKKAKKALARILVPATSSTCPPEFTLGAQGQPAEFLCEVQGNDEFLVSRESSTWPNLEAPFSSTSLFTVPEEHEMALQIPFDNFESDINFFDGSMNQLFGQEDILKGANNSPGCWKCSLFATVGINLRFLHTCSDSNVLNTIDEEFDDISSLVCEFGDPDISLIMELPQPPEPPLPLLSGFFEHIPYQHLEIARDGISSSSTAVILQYPVADDVPQDLLRPPCWNDEEPYTIDSSFTFPSELG